MTRPRPAYFLLSTWAALVLLHAGTLAAAGASSRDRLRNAADRAVATDTIPSDTVNLLVLLDAGVTGSPSDGEHAYRKGTAVRYSYRGTFDGRILTVFLDGSLVAATGTIRMDGPHSLLVSLAADLALRPDDRQMCEAMRSVLTSKDPMSAYQRLVDLMSAQYTEFDQDSVDARVRRATAAAIDVTRDSAAIRRVDVALGGHVFNVDVPPASSSAGSVARAARNGMTASTTPSVTQPRSPCRPSAARSGERAR